MPPKRKVDDPKLRRLSEFWAIPVPAAASNRPSSPSSNRIAPPSKPRSSTPSKHARASPSRPTMAQSRLARAGSLQIDPPSTPSKKPRQTTLSFATNRTPIVSSSKSKPSNSPKFLVIDDADEAIVECTQTMSRKRPRDTNANPSSLAPRPLNASIKQPEVVDLTVTPPAKRRALCTQANAALPTPLGSFISSQQYYIPVSSAEDVVPCSDPASPSPLRRITSPFKVAEVTVFARPPLCPETPISRIPGVATLPTPGASSPVLRLDLHTAPLTSSMATEERKARVEEIRRRVKAKAQANQAAERRTIHYVSDDDDDDDLALGFGPLKSVTSKNGKKGPVVPSEAESSMTARKRAGQPLNVLLPVADPECDSSENETPWPPVSTIRVATSKAPPAVFKTRSMCNSGLTSSSTESLSAPKAKPACLLKKKQAKQDPLSLECLFNGTSKSLNSGRKTNNEFAEMVNHDLAELERRQLGGTVSSESSDDEVEDEAVDETVHERVLGAEQAGKVSRMLKSDRSRLVKVTPWRPFWAANNGTNDETMDTTFTIPPLVVPNDMHPILKELERIAHENDTRGLSFILTSGVLLALPNESARRHLTTWLFKLATTVATPPELAHAAVNAFINLYSPQASRTRGQINNALECCLSVGDISQVVSDLDPQPNIFNEVFGVSQVVPPSHPCSKESREGTLFRLLGMLRAVSSAGVFLPFIDVAVLIFALIGLDNSTSDALRRDIRIAIQDMIASLDSAPGNISYTIELSICNSLLKVAAGFRSIEKEKLLSLIVGGCVRSRRVTRWIAFSLLLSRSSLSLSEDLFLKPPPLEEVAALLDQGNEEDVRFRVRKDTDYGELVSWTAVLGMCFNDVVIYHKSQPSLLDVVTTHLDQMHSAIRDGKAAFLDRTRTKDMIQRLKMRLHYQRPGAAKARLTDHFSARDSS